MFLLVSAGVFLGLMRRLNSWDVVTGPARVWHAVNAIAHSPWDIGFIAAFAIFLWLAFLVTDILDRRVYPALEANSGTVDSG